MTYPPSIPLKIIYFSCFLIPNIMLYTYTNFTFTIHRNTYYYKLYTYTNYIFTINQNLNY